MTSDGVAFRRAGPDDLRRIVELLAEDHLGAGREQIGPILDPRYLAGFEAVQRDPNQLLAVAEEQGAVIGCLQISFIPGVSRVGAWRGQIESVRIEAARRGSGLGTKMIIWAIEQCRAHDCVLVQLATDKSRIDAHRLYERLGFVASHVGMKRVLR